MLNYFNFQSKPRLMDAVILSLFTIVITLQPYFWQGEINFFELGLYLPGIEGVMEGLIPYRDFFHLRGPLELYIPAGLMQIFGVHLSVLNGYFYFGNILCLVVCVWIAYELLESRLMLYCFVPPVVARTFIRVVYNKWGGMRYAWGFITLFCVVKYYKTRKLGWLTAAGACTGLGLLTSVEIGVYGILAMVLTGIVAGVVQYAAWRRVLNEWVAFAVGMLTVSLPFLVFMICTDSLAPYVEMTLTVVGQMQKVLDPHLVSEYPRHLADALPALLNPKHINFRHITPSYLYVLLLVYLVRCWKVKSFGTLEIILTYLGVFGFVMYNTAFRAIWAAQFEMALLPEKLILFVFLGKAALWGSEKLKATPSWPSQSKTERLLSSAIVVFLIILTIGSWGYSVRRYNKRFTIVKMARDLLLGKGMESQHPMFDQASREIQSVPRLNGIVTTETQGAELEQIQKFLQDNTKPDEVVATYPELGIYHFFFARPFATRFPIATFAWFHEDWFEEYQESLRKEAPKYFIVQRKMPSDWDTVYLTYDFNRRKYDATWEIIRNRYNLVHRTQLSDIYQLNNE